MTKITRFPKGHKVIFAAPLTGKKYLMRKGLTCTEDDIKIFIECFVAGDTEEKGLSVVALDNPTCCIMHSVDSHYSNAEDRLQVAQGYIKALEFGNGSGTPQTCPY